MSPKSLLPSILIIYYLEQNIHIAKTRRDLRFSAQRKIDGRLEMQPDLIFGVLKEVHILPITKE